jgi:hypothetical protein
MKLDASPLVLRRPFARLARGLITPEVSRRLIETLRAKAPAEHVAEVVPRWHARDPRGAWAVFFAELSNGYAGIMHRAGRAARVRKDDRRPEDAVTARAPEITVPTNPYSARWIQKHGGELCVELSSRQHDMVRDVVARMYDQGRRPEDIAEHLERVVGITSRQEQAVSSYWARVLEDTGDEHIADERADRYAQSQLVYRTETIGRTENRYAVEQGRLSEWLQARDDGEIATTTIRVWNAMPASYRLCEACAALDGQEVGLDEEFYSEEFGISVEAPPLHPDCRCTQTLRFD